MAERLQLPTPMWRVQYDLLGGHRRMVVVVCVAAAVLALGILGARRFLPTIPFSRLGPYVVNVLAFVLVLLVILGGCNAVHRAMLRDHDTKMIESHRLTPMSNVAVAVGYLFGSTLQVVALTIVLLVTGSVVSYLSSLPADLWIYGCLFILNGAVTLWAAVVFFGMRPEKPVSPAPILVGIASLTVPLGMVPGAALCCSIYAVVLGIMIVSGWIAVSATALLITGIVNAALTLFWISAAAVKYRRPDLPALNGSRGLAFLALVLIISTVGVVGFQAVTSVAAVTAGPNPQPTLSRFASAELPLIQWIATMLGGILLSFVAIAGAVNCRVRGARGTGLRGWGDRLAPRHVVVLSTVVICTVMAGLGTPVWRFLGPAAAPRFQGRNGINQEMLRHLMLQAWYVSGATCLLACATIRAVLEIGYVTLKSPRFLVAMFFLVAWALPPSLDSIRAEWVRDGWAPVEYSWIMGCSPVGTIIITWSQLDAPRAPGLLVQFGIAVLLTIAAVRTSRRLKGVKSEE